MSHFTDLTPDEIGVLEKVAEHKLCIDIDGTSTERRILRKLYLGKYIGAQPCFETDCPADTIWLEER